MKLRRWAVVAVAGLALLLLAGRWAARGYADYQWYAALGAAALWRERTLLETLLRLVSGSAAALFVFLNLYAVRRSVVSIVLPRQVANLEIGEEVPGRYLVWTAVLLSVGLGALLALPASAWSSLALARHGRPFGESDPYFEADLGFFVYWLPFENTLYLWALIAVLAVTAVVIFLYALTPSLRWNRGSLYVSHYVRRHFVVLGTLMLLLLAWNFRLDAYRVLISGSGPEGMFTFADHRAAIPINLGLSILTVAVALIVLFFGWSSQLRVAFVAVSVVIVASLGLRAFGPALARRFADVQDPALRDAPYEAVRAAYTRRAYALDQLGRGDSLGARAPAAIPGTVAVWETPALERLASRADAPEIVRGVTWSASAEGLVAGIVFSGPAMAGGSARPAPWRVERVRAGQADESGGAQPASDGARPAIATLAPVLVADSLAGYAVLDDSTGRVAAPGLDGFISRVAHAWSLEDLHLLAGGAIGPDARLLTRRAVRERVSALAPFFAQGTAVTPLVWHDTLRWSVDLYAATSWYPLSAHAMLGSADVSYLHHAAVALVNASTARVTLVGDAILGPLAESWRARFPTLFAGPGALGDTLRALLPPPLDQVRAQAALVARFGVRGAALAPGHLPWNDGADSLVRLADAPPVLLPDGRLAWTQPVLDSAGRLTGLLAGTGGARRQTYWFPLNDAGGRWNAVVDRMRQALDSGIAAARDARLVHGAVRALPLADGAILVQSAYAFAPDGPPVLLRVAVARDSLVRTGRSLAEALGLEPVVSGDSLPAAARDFRSAVQALYGRMRAALRRGDMVEFGRAYDALGRLLARPAP